MAKISSFFIDVFEMSTIGCEESSSQSTEAKTTHEEALFQLEAESLGSVRETCQ